MRLDELTEVVRQRRADEKQRHQDPVVHDGRVVGQEAVPPQQVAAQGLHDLRVIQAARLCFSGC